MEHEDAVIEKSPSEVPELGLRKRKKITADRYLELAKIGKEVVDFLDRNGVVRGEECIVQQHAQEIWALSH